MDKKVLVDYNFKGNEVKEFSFERVATEPAGPFIGRTIYNTTTNLFGYWNGAKWVYSVQGAMRYKGTVGMSLTATVQELPTSGAEVGDTYKVIIAGIYADTQADIGDMFILQDDTVGAYVWNHIPSGDGTEEYIVLGDGTASEFNFPHTFGTKICTVGIFEESTGEEVITGVKLTNTNLIITFNTPPAVGEKYKVVLQKA